MPLVTCPDCGNSVSDAAPACIHCGRPMSPPAPPPGFQSPPSAAPHAPAADPYGSTRGADRDAQRIASSKTVAWIIYGLQVLSFMYMLPSLLGLIIGYLKRGDVRGTWLESHYDYQIETFWHGLAYFVGSVAVAMAIMFAFDTPTPGVILSMVLTLAVTVWFVVRVVRGALALNDNRPIR